MEATQALEESWPEHPEWVDMLTDILQSKPMGPDYGWFRTAVAQTRFDWGWAFASGSTRAATGGLSAPNLPAAIAISLASTGITTAD